MFLTTRPVDPNLEIEKLAETVAMLVLDSPSGADEFSSPEQLALVLRGRAELLHELSEALPGLSASGRFEVELAKWLREQLADVEAESSLLSQIISNPSCVDGKQ